MELTTAAPDHESVKHGKNCLLIYSWISSFEAEDILTWSDASFIGILKRQGKEIKKTLVSEQRECLHLASFIGPEFIQGVWYIGVDNIAINNRSNLKQLVWGSKTKETQRKNGGAYLSLS